MNNKNNNNREILRIMSNHNNNIMMYKIKRIDRKYRTMLNYVLLQYAYQQRRMNYT